MFDYMDIDPTPPPGAEGVDQGNGNANEYMIQPDSLKVPVESNLNNEEEKVLQEATGNAKTKKSTDKPAADNAAPATEEKKEKKGGFFRKLFGKDKDKD